MDRKPDENPIHRDPTRKIPFHTSTRLDPWSVVAFGAPAQHDERMMWAQSGLNRLMVRSSDLMRDAAGLGKRLIKRLTVLLASRVKSNPAHE